MLAGGGRASDAGGGVVGLALRRRRLRGRPVGGGGLVADQDSATPAAQPWGARGEAEGGRRGHLRGA